MWLASQLCERGLITSDQFAEAVREQLSRQTPIGVIAKRKGLLTVKQVRLILSENALEPNSCFGQTAIALGFLSDDELAVLLYSQSNDAPNICDILVDRGFISREQITSALRQFKGRVQHQPTTLVSGSFV